MTKPVGIALVVCDNIYEEPSGKKALVGLFNSIVSRKFPIAHPRLCVFASATDIKPNTTLRLDIVEAETGEPVCNLDAMVPEKVSPLTVCDFAFYLNNLMFREPGTYFIRFWGNDNLLAQRPFQVMKAKQVKS